MPETVNNGVAVGIDLGTTYSAVARVDEFGQPAVLTNTDNERTTPSVVYIDGQTAIVGRIAKEQAQIIPANTVQFIKPFVGRRRKRFVLDSVEWSSEELSAIILRKLVRDAEIAMGGDRKITHAVITVPAFFSEQQRKSTADAGRIAGIEVMGIINEPTAAAISYGFDSLGVDKTVLVYDLGGGTFDVTVMRIEGNNIIMMATDGDVQLGGKDWDERIIDIAAEAFQDRHGVDPRSDPESLSTLYLQAEQAKIRLSKLPSTRIQLRCNGISETFELTRDAFEEHTDDLLAQTETTLRLVMEEAGLSMGDIDEVLMVGGSTRMRAVKTMIENVTGQKPRPLLNPDECVAQGAAIYAAMRQLRRDDRDVGAPPVDIHPDQRTRFEQLNEKLILSHTLGIVALDNAGRQVVAPVVSRRSHIPRRELRNFSTSRPGQAQIMLRVMEGESDNPRACNELGQCLVRGLPGDLPRGTPIEVAFDCTGDGRLEVTANLPTLGQSVQTEVMRTMGLTDGEIQDARARIDAMHIE